MMLVNVNAPVKQKEIIKFLESQENTAFKYCGHPNQLVTSIQFEVDDEKAGGYPVAYTKQLIKSAPFGKMLAFQVVEAGKAW